MEKLTVSYCMMSDSSNPRITVVMFGHRIQPLKSFSVSEEGLAIMQQSDRWEALMSDLISIDGIERLEVTPNSVFVTRALLASWTELLTELLAACAMGIKRMANPKKPTDVEIIWQYVNDSALNHWLEGVEQQQNCWVDFGQETAPTPTLIAPEGEQ